MAKAKNKPRKAVKPSYKPDPDRRRLQVICTKDQEATVTAAAAAAGAKDRSAWILDKALTAATSEGAVTIPQPLAGQLADHARMLGHSPAELVAQWLAGSRGVLSGSGT